DAATPGQAAGATAGRRVRGVSTAPAVAADARHAATARRRGLGRDARSDTALPAAQRAATTGGGSVASARARRGRSGCARGRGGSDQGTGGGSARVGEVRRVAGGRALRPGRRGTPHGGRPGRRRP